MNLFFPKISFIESFAKEKKNPEHEMSYTKNSTQYLAKLNNN